MRPAGPCDAWCGHPPFLLCCDNRCPVDVHPVHGCDGLKENLTSTLQVCRHNKDCPGNSLCCWDRCAGLSKCINDVYYSIETLL
ncbi:uncharacterized protein [Palaemon carinicauda]|uniref:uncharacterized protein n=1 Tax=Palaemon carinicauda TaxID=392227 RepID=UPI0035B5BE0E